MDELVGKTKLGGYLIHVIRESIQGDVNVIEQPAEEGLPLTDHIEKKPFMLSIEGTLVRPTQERVDQLIATLEKFRDSGKLLSYEGRRIYSNIVIENFSYDADHKISNGYRFSMKLKQIRIAKSAYIALPPKPKTQVKTVTSAGKKQPANKKNTPVYHVVKQGDTYWALGNKYGVKWQQLQSWNKYAPTKIPIGAKLRVG
ncbi:phage baseplate protein [Mycobacteroides abscessus]|uniref:phage baseplate protein n=1 Tax=Mycobacteroides abscessus TaxID=36809 RepID=UPI0012FFFBF3